MPQDSNYEVILSPQAQRALNVLPPDIQLRIDAKILALAENPRLPGVKALQGYKGLLRIRVGNYRVTYQVDDTLFLVTIVQIGHRRDVYRRR